ncbi:MAG: DUF423 domain-containing protein [Hyphomonadaceae bacterium]
MRLVHIAAALTGAACFVLLAYAQHGAPAASMEAVTMAALAQISAAAGGLAIARASGRLAATAGAMILIGANIFAGVIYLNAFVGDHPLRMLAPLGGGLLILGWLVLAFARPRRNALSKIP